MSPEDEARAALVQHDERLPSEAHMLPEGFDAIDLGELLDVTTELVGWLRVGSFDELAGERDAEERAERVLSRYKPARSSS